VPPASLELIRELGIVYKAPTASGRYPSATAVSLLLRRELATYANVNELRSFPGVASALRPNIDVLLVRENSEGLFAGHSAYPSADTSIDLRIITRQATRRIARLAFALARARRGKVTVVAFVVPVNSDKLFVAGCEEVAGEFPDVEWSVIKPDSFAGTVVTNPEQYDVVLAPNEWGSVMTDLVAAACGSVALAARSNLGERTGYFEPIHGTAPGKAGKGTVNPISQMLAGKLLLQWLGERYDDASAARAAQCLDAAIAGVLSAGAVLTTDLGGEATTADVVRAVCDEIGALGAGAGGNGRAAGGS
jgi:isocitrate/isopropylmalate dehydrogenase